MPLAERTGAPRGPRGAPASEPFPEPDEASTGPPAREVARVADLPVPVELAESPFATDRSPELDYAVQLVFGPDAGPDTWRSAAEVFERCLKQVPGHQRCYQGLIAAQSRLAGEDAGVTAADLMPPIPEVDTSRNMLINPSVTEGVARPVRR